MSLPDKAKEPSAKQAKKHLSMKTLWREERYSILLASVFIYNLLSVILPDKTWAHFLLDAIFFILVLSVIFEVARVRSLFSFLGVLGLLAILGHGLSRLWGGTLLSRTILPVSSIMFFAAAIIHVSKKVLGAKIVTHDTIRGAIIIYLLIGALFTSVYVLVEVVSPGSFLMTNSAGIPTASSREGISKFFGYFSMVTLTTLGYGDIIPIKELSRTTAWIEAFTGQIYLAVIIARLVGAYIAQSMKETS